MGHPLVGRWLVPDPDRFGGPAIRVQISGFRRSPGQTRPAAASSFSPQAYGRRRSIHREIPHPLTPLGPLRGGLSRGGGSGEGRRPSELFAGAHCGQWRRTGRRRQAPDGRDEESVQRLPAVFSTRALHASIVDSACCTASAPASMESAAVWKSNRPIWPTFGAMQTSGGSAARRQHGAASTPRTAKRRVPGGDAGSHARALRLRHRASRSRLRVRRLHRVESPA